MGYEPGAVGDKVWKAQANPHELPMTVFKQCIKRGATIALWMCLRVHSFCPGFESQAHHLCFYHL